MRIGKFVVFLRYKLYDATTRQNIATTTFRKIQPKITMKAKIKGFGNDKICRLLGTIMSAAICLTLSLPANAQNDVLTYYTPIITSVSQLSANGNPNTKPDEFKKLINFMTYGAEDEYAYWDSADHGTLIKSGDIKNDYLQIKLNEVLKPGDTFQFMFRCQQGKTNPYNGEVPDFWNFKSVSKFKIYAGVNEYEPFDLIYTTTQIEPKFIYNVNNDPCNFFPYRSEDISIPSESNKNYRYLRFECYEIIVGVNEDIKYEGNSMRMSRFQIYLKHTIANTEKMDIKTGFNVNSRKETIDYDNLFDEDKSAHTVWSSYPYGRLESDGVRKDENDYLRITNIKNIALKEGDKKYAMYYLVIRHPNDANYSMQEITGETDEDKKANAKAIYDNLEKTFRAYPTSIKISGVDNTGKGFEQTINVPNAFTGGEAVIPVPIQSNFNRLEISLQSNHDNSRGKGYDERIQNGLTAKKCLMMNIADLAPFRVMSDDPKDLHNPKYKDFKWVHTHGQVEKIEINNNRGNWLPLDDWDHDGKYINTTNKEKHENADIKFPEFGYLTPENDKRIKEGVRQPCYIVEHTVYAVPGRRVDLYPFSDIYSTPCYEEDFCRWYDYSTDKASEYVYLFTDPSHGSISEDGLYTGNSLIEYPHVAIRPGGVASFFYDGDSETVPETWIAADFANFFRENIDQRIDHDSKTIKEPTITFRHLFHILPGSKCAEDLSGSKENNEKWVKNSRRFLTARAGNDFSIRLDYPMAEDVKPNEKNKDIKATKSALYVYNPDYSDSDPNEEKIVRLGSYEIKTYKYDEKTNGAKGDELGYFKAFERSMYYTVSAYTSTKDFTNDLIWVKNYKPFYRAITCDGIHAIADEKYVVQIVGKRINGETATIKGTTDPVIIQEYIVEFLPEERAHFVEEEKLKESKYERHQNEYLEKHFGNPITVNFDKYNLLASNLIHKSTNKNLNVESRRVKIPYSWDAGNYGFNYKDNGDYNMFKICDHSTAVNQNKAANKRTIEENFGIGSGTYDRLFYETKGEQKGYFYFINAASDPGDMVRINIQDLCKGSTLYVSAWVNEFNTSYEETANVIFNFEVLTGENTWRKIHSFSTGYVPNDEYNDKKTEITKPGSNGKWMHVFYRFSPNFDALGIHQNQIKGYRLVLENNCISSVGADYAVDDIRVYVAKPQVYATQLSYLCKPKSKEEQQTEKEGSAVKLSMPFVLLLNTIGKSESPDDLQDNDVDLYYSILDKTKFDQFVKENKTAKEVYEESVELLKYNNGTYRYGKVSFKSHYNVNSEKYDATTTEKVYYEDVDNIKSISFNTPEIKGLKVGHEYLIVIYPSEHSEKDELYDVDNVTKADYFQISEIMKGDVANCAKYGVFRVNSAHIVKVDGKIVQDTDNIVCCENQHPVIQLDLQGQKKDGEPSLLSDGFDIAEYCSAFDWYVGTYDEFFKENNTNGNGKSLHAVLTNFRLSHPEATTWDVATTDKYTEADRLYLKELCESGKLILGKHSYVLPTVKIDKGQTEKDVYAVAVPVIDWNKLGNYADVINVCTEPYELKVTVSNTSPVMLDGFKEITYPEGMDDVPLRVGKRQIDAIKVQEPTADAHVTGGDVLRLPIRTVSPASAEVKRLKPAADPLVYLTETNDPAYKNLEDRTDGDKDSPNGSKGLMPVGELKALTAEKSGDANIADIYFYNDVVLREGYYYRLRFGYEEDYSDGFYSSDLPPCAGETLFTLKIVPEYQKWTGEAKNADKGYSNNWNNDGNWRRISSQEIKASSTTDRDDLLTDDNSTAISYAPLDFTKVIIQGANEAQRKTCPYLFNPSPKDLPIFNGSGKTEAEWSSTATATGQTLTGDATTDIKYDMASKTNANGKTIYCWPWYAHTCDQIHFEPEAEMYMQNELRYNKAWVDMEMIPGKWLAAAAPLQDMVAGDMYLPSDNARQATEYFLPINFDNNKNDRFAPAVYQRGWDKGNETVYELPPASAGETRNVAVRATWSHVYNDVAVSYAPGSGYSVKTDVSRLGNRFETSVENPGKVLFRFPKADTAYEYQTDGKPNTERKTERISAIANTRTAWLRPAQTAA